MDYYGKRVVTSICKLEKERIFSAMAHESEVQNTTPLKMIPKYLIPAAAGYATPLEGEDYEMIPIVDKSLIQADFAVRICGNSMYPYICDGDIVYVKRNADIHTGDIGIFAVNSAIYCKQYYPYGDSLYLISLNPEQQGANVYIDSTGDTNLVCYGKVIIDNIPIPKYFTASSLQE